MGNIWRMLSDVTYPIVAYTTVRFHGIIPDLSTPTTCLQGHEFNRSIYKVLLSSFIKFSFTYLRQAFYDLHIEDMWLPYFCNTTNIITSRMEIHKTGYAWRFIRKAAEISMSLFSSFLQEHL